MSMHPKLVELEPSKYLVFQRPFNTPKTQTLRIKNITESSIIFKIKTTAPNNYIVNPNCAEIKPQASRDIEIRRNATNEEFPPDYKCKDKFLVQSMKINEDEVIKNNTDPKEFQKYLMAKFQDMDKQKKINPVDAKKILGEDRLTCVYLLPNDTSATIPEVEENGSSRESLTTNTVDATSNVTAIPASITSSTIAATKLRSPSENEELISAREKIKELEKALEAYKKGKVGTTTTSRDIKAPSSQLMKGAPKDKKLVPVELIAIVAILSFLIGAFCF